MSEPSACKSWESLRYVKSGTQNMIVFKAIYISKLNDNSP